MPSTIQEVPFHTMTIGEKRLPRIIFLHGFLGSGGDWLPLARTLCDDYCCVMVDLPGHGKASFRETPPSDGFFEQTVDALAELLRQSAFPPSYLVGYSMGGRIALGGWMGGRAGGRVDEPTDERNAPPCLRTGVPARLLRDWPHTE